MPRKPARSPETIRVTEHNDRRRAKGQKLATVHIWTDGEESAEKARAVMRRAGEKFRAPAPPVND